MTDQPSCLRAEPRAPAAVSVAFPAGRGVQWWADRHRTSPVPGLWPYGLDRLAGAKISLAATELPALSRPARLLAPQFGLRRLRSSGPAAAVAIGWDELTAVRMVRYSRADRLIAGVIWATDEVCRGGNERALAIQRHALRQLDGLWVLSRPQAELVRQWLGPGAPPVSFLPFGVDETFYAATPYPERPCIVSIGGDRDRDAQSLFRVLATVVRARPDVRCVVQTSSVLAPPPGVRTLASVPHDQVRQLYAEASAVLIATRPNWHGSGMTVALEAMSSGRPVVASDTPGLADYVRPGATGELVTPGDAAGQAERVLSLLQDRDRAAAMGAAGRRVVETDHTAGGMCEKLRTLIGL